MKHYETMTVYTCCTPVKKVWLLPFFTLGFFSIAEAGCQQGENQTWPPRIKNLIVCTWLSFSQKFRFVKKVPWCSYSVCMSMSFPAAKLHFILLQQELNGCSHQAAASTTRHKALGRSLENDTHVRVLRFWIPGSQPTTRPLDMVEALIGWTLTIENGMVEYHWTSTTVWYPSFLGCCSFREPQLTPLLFHYQLQTTKSSMQTALGIPSHPKLLYKQHQFWKILLWICCLKFSWKHPITQFCIWPHCFNSHL